MSALIGHSSSRHALEVSILQNLGDATLSLTLLSGQLRLVLIDGAAEIHLLVEESDDATAELEVDLGSLLEVLLQLSGRC